MEWVEQACQAAWVDSSLFFSDIALFGFDCLTSMTAVSATLTNSGPGLGQIVGPSGTYATIPALAKFVLMMGKQFLQKK